MTYLMKCHRNPKGKVVAACDPDLLGQTFTDGDISLTVDASFYDGEEVTLDAILEKLTSAKTGNFVGPTLIEALLAEGLIRDDQIKHIDGTPHSQVFYL